MLPVTTSTFERPVAPVATVRPVGADARRGTPSAPTAAVITPSLPTWDSLRSERAAALAELDGDDARDAHVSRYLGLDRDQLAAMVYDRSSAFSLEQRRGARQQLEQNDREFIDRAAELASVSGDQRVLLNAQIELQRLKLPIERALPKGEAVTSIEELEKRVAETTVQLGNAPLSITLRYPNSRAASGGGGLPMPDSESIGKVLPGATRVALLYRESLF